MRKKLLSFILFSTLCMSSMTAFAGSYTSDGSADVAVNAEVSPSWQVTVPASLSLEKKTGTRDEYEHEYTINCYGLIADNKAVCVEPANTSFQLTGSSSQGVVTANITQGKKYFVSETTTGSVPSTDNANVYIAGNTSYTDTKGTINGKVSAKFTKSDTYSGNFTIKFSYVGVQ